MMRFKTARGFTLVELLIVIAIIGLLSGIVLASVNKARKLALNAAMSENFHLLLTTMEQYYGENGNSFGGACDSGTTVLNNLIQIADTYGGGDPEPSVSAPGWSAGDHYSCYIGQNSLGGVDYLIGVKTSNENFYCFDSSGGLLIVKNYLTNCFYQPSN